MYFIVFAVLLSLGTTWAAQCESNGTMCIDQEHFQQCLGADDHYRLVGNGTACPDGTICDHSSGTAICRKLDGLPSFTRNLQSDEEIVCDGPTKLPAPSCYQYYQCEPILWWWQPELKNCPDGQAFDIESRACWNAASVDCQSRTSTTSSTSSTSTTTATSTTEQVIVCDGPAKLPALSCYQYYQCEQILWWWQPELKNCPDDQAFDIDSEDCREAALVDCQSRSTTTSGTSSTTSTTTLLPPVVVPECKGRSKHPALACYQYFECVPKLWWWTPVLKTCPKGQAFDRQTQDCVCAGLVNCVLPVSSVSCDGPGTLPGLTCRSFYKCVPFLWWWEPKLRQCHSGEVYDKSTCQCVPEGTVPCFGPEPECQGYAKYPAAKDNQYYECTLDDSGLRWTPVLKTCNWGMVFLPSRGKCVLGGWFN